MNLNNYNQFQIGSEVKFVFNGKWIFGKINTIIKKRNEDPGNVLISFRCDDLPDSNPMLPIIEFAKCFLLEPSKVELIQKVEKKTQKIKLIEAKNVTAIKLLISLITSNI